MVDADIAATTAAAAITAIQCIQIIIKWFLFIKLFRIDWFVERFCHRRRTYRIWLWCWR